MNRTERRKIGLCTMCHAVARENRSLCEKHLRSSQRTTEKYLLSDKGKKTRERLKPKMAEWRRKDRRGNGRFKYVKTNAIVHKKEWTLTEEEYYQLIAMPCFYCKFPNDVVAGAGLDRKDNKKGYVQGNCVSCCSTCNMARGDRFTVEEMILLGKVIRKIKKARS